MNTKAKGTISQSVMEEVLNSWHDSEEVIINLNQLLFFIPMSLF